MQAPRRLVLLALIAILTASVAAAQVALPFHLIPISSKLKGAAETDWVTDLTIVNIGTRAGTVGIHYFPAAQGNTFDGIFMKQVPLGPGEGLLVKDLIASYFPAYGTSTSGFIGVAHDRLACDGDALRLAVTSRVYNNANPSKTFGQTVESSLFAANFTDLPSIIAGVRHNGLTVPGYRTNVGVTNVSTRAINVTIKVIRDDGSVAGSGTRTVEALSVRQWGLGEFVSSLESGRIEITMDRANMLANRCAVIDEETQICFNPCSDRCVRYTFPLTGAFIAWASKVDNGSGDAEFLLPVMDWIGLAAECGWEITSMNGPAGFSELFR